MAVNYSNRLAAAVIEFAPCQSSFNLCEADGRLAGANYSMEGAMTCRDCGARIEDRVYRLRCRQCEREAMEWRRSGCPSPRVIRKRAAEIRAEWSRETLLERKAR